MRGNPDMTALTELLSRDTDCESLAAVIDEVAFEYADSVIANTRGTIPGRRECDNLYWLKALRDAVWHARHPAEES